MSRGGTQNEEHEALIEALVTAFGGKYNIRIWRRPVGYDQTRHIRYGKKGEPDLDGIIFPNGRKLCIEGKTGDAKLSKDQLKRKKMLEKFGALYIVARSRDWDIETGVKNALDEFETKNIL